MIRLNNKIKFTPFINKTHLNFQCSNNMTLEQITNDINKYLLEHNETDIYIDRTELPIYFKRYRLIRDNTLWDK